MDPMIKNSFSSMLICWNDIKIHLGFEDSYFVPPPTSKAPEIPRTAEIPTREEEIPRRERTTRKPLGLTNRIHASSLGFHI